MQRLAFVVVLIAGCAEVAISPRTAPLLVSVPPRPTHSAPPRSTSSPGAPATQAAFVVAGKDGVFALDSAGNRRRVGKAKDAAAPRFLPGRRAIVFLHANRELVELDLETGVERVLVGPWPTAVECPGVGPAALALQSEQDVKLDVNGRYVCIDLLDRNVNMASFAVSIRADLVARTFEMRPTFGCRPTETAERFVCDEETQPTPVPVQHPYSFDEKAGVFRDPSGHALGHFAGWAEWDVSSNGRWLVIWGNVEEGDYIHFNLLVADLLTGALWPVPEPVPGTKTAWPAELSREELADPSRQRFGTRAGDFVAENGVQFMEADALVVGDLLLLLAERRVIELGGDLAR